MPNRPTIKDLAREAGVSSATVDRVLNGRSTVRRATAERVLLTAERIGYHAAGLLKLRYNDSLPRRRVCFLMQRSSDPFYQKLGAALVEACHYGGQIKLVPELRYMDEISAPYIAKQLAAAREFDAVALVTLDHKLTTTEIEGLHAIGVPVYALLTDISTQSYGGYIGWDSEKVGRTAGWTIKNLCKQAGTVGILLGSHRYLGQKQAEESFIQYFKEQPESFTLLPSALNLDNDELCAACVSDMLDRNPDLIGIYSAGGGTKGLIDTLRAEASDRGLIVVCNELTEHSREALKEGLIDLVISTPIHGIATQTVQQIQRALVNSHKETPIKVSLPAELYISENI